MSKDRLSISGIILAGGKSSRMKSDKAFLKLGEKTIIEELISRLEKKFQTLIIIANDREKYEIFGKPVIKDIIPDKGPLGGIYTGLVTSDSFYNFIFSCDAPFVNFDLIDYMSDNLNNVDIIVPRCDGRFHPLHAIYSTECINPIREQLDKNDLKVTNFFSKVNTRVVDESELEKLDLGQEPFRNINTREDYNKVIQ